jgi:uncharacterized protein (DUF305 family)
MNRKILFYTLLTLCAGNLPAFAGVEPSYEPHKPRAVTPWYGSSGEQERQADLGFIAGMRPHHAGALSMSKEYLGNAHASSSVLQQLARGIIHNQEFEIGMLDTVQENLTRPLDGNMRRIATDGLSQKQRFTRMPMPGPLDAWAGKKEVSAEDVRFAKAMIIHHQAALDMANDYLKNPHAKNGYLERMCLDILLDQEQEIAFMQSVIDSYPGDADAIKIDPSMVHGMEGMHHHAQAEKPQQVKPQKTKGQATHHHGHH